MHKEVSSNFAYSFIRGFMAMTPEEIKKRQDLIKQEKEVISKINDTSLIQKHVRDNKKKHNEQIEQENPQKKVATPPPLSDKNL